MAAVGALALVVPGPAGAAGTSGSSGTGKLSAHIDVCQEYSNNGVPDLKTTTTEATGGTISVPDAGITCYVVPFSSATCTAVVGGVQCALPDTLGLPFFSLETLVSEADDVSKTVSLSTAIVITAYGGNGGAGDAAPASAHHGGAGGHAVEAQAALTWNASYEAAYEVPLLFYYLGYQGNGSGQHGDKVGGLGGSSTIVAPADFAGGTTAPCIGGYASCASTNVLALAGGGGGGATDAGGGGGAGGSFAAQSTVAPQPFTSPTHTSGNGQVYVTFVLS